MIPVPHVLGSPKRYSIIYADPPWTYSDWNCNGATANHYSTMSLSQICSLPIESICAPDSVLFLWATYPMLQEALSVIKAWGFTYKSSAFVWIKMNTRTPTPFYGLGRWTRGNTEPCLLATRGKPHRLSNAVSQLIIEPHGRHSEKPAIVRDRIIDLMGDISRVEIFARQKTPGWDIWGNELPNDVRLSV